MRLVVIASDGERLTRPVPRSWADIPLLAYCRLVSATTLPQRIEALAELLAVPAQPLLDEVDKYAAIAGLMPWLFKELPPAGEPVTEFRHLGTRYVSQGALSKLTAQQLEALYDLQQVYAETPILAAPALLAVLYNPAGASHSPEMYQATGAAFATLPLSVAWPALVDFIGSGLSAAHSIRMFLALAPQVERALTEVETALQKSSATTRFWQRPLRWALRRWIKSARATASTASN